MRYLKPKIVKAFALLILSGGVIGSLVAFHFIVTELIPYVLKCID